MTKQHKMETATEQDKFKNLARALIRFCIKDGDNASNELSEKLCRMQQHVSKLESQITENTENKEELYASLGDLKLEIMESVVILQFFDRVAQRLDHVLLSIDAIDSNEEFRANMSMHFTMEDERIIHNALLSGDTISVAIDKANNKLNQIIDNNDDIELF